MNGLDKVREWSGAARSKGGAIWSTAQRGFVRCRKEMQDGLVSAHVYALTTPSRIIEKLRDSKGQGTTEYAILVGVIVVIAIIAVMAFKDKIQSLWNGIAEGINGL